MSWLFDVEEFNITSYLRYLTLNIYSVAQWKWETVFRFHLICNSLRKLLKQPKTLTCYICCLVIVNLNISLMHIYIYIYIYIHISYIFLTYFKYIKKIISQQDITTTVHFCRAVSFGQYNEFQFSLSLWVKFSKVVAKIYFLSNLQSWNP